MAKKKKQTLWKRFLQRLSGALLTATSVFLIAGSLALHFYGAAVDVASDVKPLHPMIMQGLSAARSLYEFWGVLMPLFLIAPVLWGYDLLRLREVAHPVSRFFSWIFGIIFGATFMANLPGIWGNKNLGGNVGRVQAEGLNTLLNDLFSNAYSSYVAGAFLLVMTVFFFDFAVGITYKDWWRWLKIFSLQVYRFVSIWSLYIYKGIRWLGRFRLPRLRKDESGEDETVEIKAEPKKAVKLRKEPKVSDDDNSIAIESKPAEKKAAKSEVKKESRKAKSADDGYQFPDTALLSRPSDKGGNTISEKELESIARDLEGVLEEFGVHGKIVKVRPGPVVTLYELEPAPGTKTARVIGLADDIARSMSAVSVRIAVVPGSNTIGIEMPNKNRETVWLRDLFDDPQFRNSKNELNVVLGKDIGGRNVYADLARMPHLLVAGTTGSGKSVGVNSMILSLLFKMRPDECKLIMIDPKMLEFSMYNGIPHLLTPVITDPSKAVIGLKWAVKEMEDRYRAMAQINVRNIMGYNQKLRELKASGEVIKRTVQTGFDMETGKPIYEEQELDLTPLPYIVIVVDEMADLMLVAGKEVEAAIQRLAQMARAAGLHLIMSTQRPSVDVITGTIKANFPTRISYQVTSKIDSRTILGEQGAEQLLGRGDMLYMPAGQRPQRVHGGFAPDAEIEKVVEFIKTQKEPEYVEGVTEGELSSDKKSGGAVFDKGDMGGGDSDEDLYSQAVAIVQADKKASISYVQRRLRIGYNRAASLIDRMEEEGVISAPDHVGRREVL